MPVKNNIKPSDLLSEQQIISYIYDIALDPGNLDGFIDRLESTANDHSGDSSELAQIGTLSALLESHLSRAEEFLDRTPETMTPAVQRSELWHRLTQHRHVTGQCCAAGR